MARLALMALLAVGCDATPREWAGASLLQRVESHLEARRDALDRHPGHQGLIGPVDSDRLVAALADIRVHRSGDGFALGTELVPEPHGGGILSLLLDHWRPDGRRAGLDNRFRFGTGGTEIALRDLYEGYKRQVFLPSALPGEPTRLPRMRFAFPAGGPPIETDAYHVLRLLVTNEPDPARTWQNQDGQTLSVDALLGRVREQFLSTDPAHPDVSDHTNLHRVELLLAYHERFPGALDPEAVRTHALLAFDAVPQDTEVLAHDAESLGLLAATGGLKWSDEDAARVSDWLAFLGAGPFSNLDAVPLQHLCHLLRGLRLLAEHRDRLGL